MFKIPKIKFNTDKFKINLGTKTLIFILILINVFFLFVIKSLKADINTLEDAQARIDTDVSSVNDRLNSIEPKVDEIYKNKETEDKAKEMTRNMELYGSFKNPYNSY